jgi:hypothetical protein
VVLEHAEVLLEVVEPRGKSMVHQHIHLLLPADGDFQLPHDGFELLHLSSRGIQRRAHYARITLRTLLAYGTAVPWWTGKAKGTLRPRERTEIDIVVKVVLAGEARRAEASLHARRAWCSSTTFLAGLRPHDV